jgi:hypothetical protein
MIGEVTLIAEVGESSRHIHGLGRNIYWPGGLAQLIETVESSSHVCCVGIVGLGYIGCFVLSKARYLQGMRDSRV